MNKQTNKKIGTPEISPLKKILKFREDHKEKNHFFNILDPRHLLVYTSGPAL